MSTLPIARAAAAALAVAACHSAAGVRDPAGERRAELLEVTVPATVAAGAPFTATGHFGRGACDARRPVVERTRTSARVGLRVVPPTGPCIDVLVIEPVAVDVAPPFELPYTLRFERPTGGDSVVVVRAVSPDT